MLEISEDDTKFLYAMKLVSPKSHSHTTMVGDDEWTLHVNVEKLMFLFLFLS